MKNNLYGYKFFLLLFLIGFLATCKEYKKEEEQNQDGIWGDVIGFSQDTFSFKSEAGEAEVTTKGAGWEINAFVNYRTYEFIQFCKLDSISGISTYDWVSIQKIDRKKVKISVKENTSEKPRSISIQFAAGDYFGYLRIKQEGVEK